MNKIEKLILDRGFAYVKPYFYKNQWALRCELGIGNNEDFDISAKKRANEIYNILFPNGADAVIFNYWINDYLQDGDAELDGYGEDDVRDHIESIIEYEAEQLRFLLDHQAKYRHVCLRRLAVYEEYDCEDDAENGFSGRDRIVCYSDGKGFDYEDYIDRQLDERRGHEISFVSFENECILSIYDSRGCDIVFATPEKMKIFYNILEPYFLDYDREEMRKRYERI